MATQELADIHKRLESIKSKLNTLTPTERETMRKEEKVKLNPAEPPKQSAAMTGDKWKTYMTVVQMRALLKENKISGYSGKTKAELIAMIEKHKLKETKEVMKEAAKEPVEEVAEVVAKDERSPEIKQGLYSLVWYLWHDEDDYWITDRKKGREILGKTQHTVWIRVTRPVVAEEIFNLRGKLVSYDGGWNVGKVAFLFPSEGFVEASLSVSESYLSDDDIRVRLKRLYHNDDDFIKNASVEIPYDLKLKISEYFMKLYKEDKEDYGDLGESGKESEDSYRIGKLVDRTQIHFRNVYKKDVEKVLLEFMEMRKSDGGEDFTIRDKEAYLIGRDGYSEADMRKKLQPILDMFKSNDDEKHYTLKFSEEAGGYNASGLEGFVDPIVAHHKKDITKIKDAKSLATKTLKEMFPTAKKIDDLVMSSFIKPVQVDGGIRIYQQGDTIKGELIYDEVVNSDASLVRQIVKKLL